MYEIEVTQTRPNALWQGIWRKRVNLQWIFMGFDMINQDIIKTAHVMFLLSMSIYRDFSNKDAYIKITLVYE